MPRPRNPTRTPGRRRRKRRRMYVWLNSDNGHFYNLLFMVSLLCFQYTSTFEGKIEEWLAFKIIVLLSLIWPVLPTNIFTKTFLFTVFKMHWHWSVCLAVDSHSVREKPPSVMKCRYIIILRVIVKCFGLWRTGLVLPNYRLVSAPSRTLVSFTEDFYPFFNF